MPFKFERLEVWQLALDYADIIHDVAVQLPSSERYNLESQIVRAATSIALNIAEGAIGQSDPDQARFLGYAIRSLVETVACQHLIHRRDYLEDLDLLRKAYRMSETLVSKLHAMRKSIAPDKPWVRESPVEYERDEEPPF